VAGKVAVPLALPPFGQHWHRSNYS